ncbi:hypothetical protein BD309DRAFT_972752 [Dichomitus squalens]|nr:hypothetical protein BD309DRAFT_972752 [Dichomitus squalens]
MLNDTAMCMFIFCRSSWDTGPSHRHDLCRTTSQTNIQPGKPPRDGTMMMRNEKPSATASASRHPRHRVSFAMQAAPIPLRNHASFAMCGYFLPDVNARTGTGWETPSLTAGMVGSRLVSQRTRGGSSRFRPGCSRGRQKADCLVVDII